MAAANKRACTQATADHEISLCFLEPSVAKFAPDAVPEYVPAPDGTCPLLTETRYTNPPKKTRGSCNAPSKDGWSVWAWVLAILKRLAALGTQADTMETRHQEMVASNLVAAAAVFDLASSIENLKLRVVVLEMKNVACSLGMTTMNQALTENQVQINEIAENLAQQRRSIDTAQASFEARLDDFDTPLCPVTGLTVIEEIQEALSENTEAIAALQGHVIPRLDDLEAPHWTRQRLDDQERILTALCLKVQILPKVLKKLLVPSDLDISRLNGRISKQGTWFGGRITNLEERMHSLAGTFTDHEELTQVRQEQLRTELLIRLDPPVL